MEYDSTTKTNEEIIGYLCTLTQNLPRTEATRGTPRIGYYLTLPKKMGRFKDGKLVKKPWKDISLVFTKTSLP